MRYSEIVDSGLYVAVKFSKETINDLENLVNELVEHGMSNPVDDFHATVVYSRKNIDWDTATDIDETARPIGFEKFDTKEDKKCLVLLLTSDYLSRRFNLAMEKGATYDFDDYRPHITLSYDCGDFDISKLSIPDFTVHISEEYSSPLED